MNTSTISCNSCGAPLPASSETPTSETQFITCPFCEARLRVVQEGSSLRTEEIEELREEADESQTRLRLLEIDHEWQEERVRYMLSGEGGEKIVPDYRGARVLAIGTFGLFLGGLVCLLLGIFVYWIATWAIALIAGFGALYARGKADRYEAARRRYRNRRRDVLREARHDRAGEKERGAPPAS